jgi:hypothetical protein
MRDKGAVIPGVSVVGALLTDQIVCWYVAGEMEEVGGHRLQPAPRPGFLILRGRALAINRKDKVPQKNGAASAIRSGCGCRPASLVAELLQGREQPGLFLFQIVSLAVGTDCGIRQLFFYSLSQA